jgi:hypothetical protein
VAGHGGPRESPLWSEYYEVHARPVPNWLGHAVLALLLGIAPPLVAEKLLLSAIVLLFLYGLRYLAGAVAPERRPLALLGFPFTYHWLLQMGFYNFSLGLGLYLLAVGFWWRRRARAGLRLALAGNALLLLCYFAHIMALLLALASIGVLWLATLERGNLRRHLLHVPILAPQLALPLWFVSTETTAALSGGWSFAAMANFLFRLQVLFTFGAAQRTLGTALAVLFALLLAFTFWRCKLRRGDGRPRPRFLPEDGFLLLAVLFVVLFFVAPDGSAGGSLVKQRLSLFPYLVLVPWLSPAPLRAAKGVGTVALALLALWNVAFLVRWERALDREMREMLAGLEPVPPGSRVLVLLFDRHGPAARIDIYGHVVDYVAIEKGLIDWDNYEAATDLFPTRFRPWVQRPDLWDTYFHVEDVQIAPWAPRTDYVYAWKMPPDSPTARRVRRHYRLLAEHGGGQLYERQRRRRREPAASPAAAPGASRATAPAASGVR